MKVYREGTGEKYTPFNHHDMKTQVIFNPETGSKHANVTLSLITKETTMDEEIHENSDQIFYIMQGQMKVWQNGQLVQTLNKGDAVLVEAGDVHGVSTEIDEPCIYYAVTVPPLEKTH